MKFILLRILYLTPFAYIINMLSLLNNERITGIEVHLPRYSPIRANVKKIQPVKNG